MPRRSPRIVLVEIPVYALGSDRRRHDLQLNGSGLTASVFPTISNWSQGFHSEPPPARSPIGGFDPDGGAFPPTSIWNCSFHSEPLPARSPIGGFDPQWQGIAPRMAKKMSNWSRCFHDHHSGPWLARPPIGDFDSQRECVSPRDRRPESMSCGHQSERFPAEPPTGDFDPLAIG